MSSFPPLDDRWEGGSKEGYGCVRDSWGDCTNKAKDKVVPTQGAVSSCDLENSATSCPAKVNKLAVAYHRILGIIGHDIDIKYCSLPFSSFTLAKCYHMYEVFTNQEKRIVI